MKQQQLLKKYVIAMTFLLLLLIMGGTLAACRTSDGIKSVTKTLPPRTFTVGASPRLVVQAGSVDIHIYAGESGKVTVEGKMVATGVDVGPNLDPNSLKLDYAQNGDAITINATTNGNVIAGSKSFEMNIALPHNGIVEASTGASNVDIEGINGSITLKGSSGDITVKNVSGQMSLNTGSGDIKLEQVKLEGRSQLKSNTGDITFQGSLDPQGNYQMQTGSGNVSISLSGDAAFQLKAQTKRGEMNNEFKSESVGNAPRPPLEIQSNSGDITLKKV
jgi:hypothetical protein